MKIGRECPVLKNGAHEAMLYMFPNGHSVVGEMDYLSPMSAVWKAWELRCDLIFLNSANHQYSPSMHLPLVFRSDLPCKSALRNSQGPHSVHSHLKRVQFDDRIEFAVQTEQDVNFHSVFVSHLALQDWHSKPWFYRPKPPSRRFSWRKLTNLSYPFCSADSSSHVYGEGCDTNKENDLAHIDITDENMHVSSRSGRSEIRALADITNTVASFSNIHDRKRAVGAPLSTLAVLSSHPSSPDQINVHSCHENDVYPHLELSDAFSSVQKNRPSITSFKNEPNDFQQAFQWQISHENHEQQEGDGDDLDSQQGRESEGYSPSSELEQSIVNPPSSDEGRQDVMLFHLRDQPIRAMISWNSYEEMITEIAHHMAMQRDAVVDAYEVVTSPSDLGNEVVPTIVHVQGDISPTSTERLVLVDIDVHAHRTEPNFRTGPETVRAVYPMRRVTTREEVLFVANQDKYCRAENDRCLVYLNARRWPDYDTDRKTLEHGDYIKIAVPPSERFVCPTASISEMTQRGLSDQQILDEIYHDDAASGFSPSLLGDDEVKDLAAGPGEELDEVFTMQIEHAVVPDGNAGAAELESCSSNSTIPQDWHIDLQRIVQEQIAREQRQTTDEFDFALCTWFLDHHSHHRCRDPKVVFLGTDPSEWREAILEPWKHRLSPDDTALLDLVAPYTPRAGLETCIAHVIITQRPGSGSSVLFSMEFFDNDSPSVIVRTAVVIPTTCTSQALSDRVPLFHSFSSNDRLWIHPQLDNEDQEFQSRFGMGIEVKILPADDDSNVENYDDVNLMQRYLKRAICAETKNHPCGSASCSGSLINFANQVIGPHEQVVNKPEQLDLTCPNFSRCSLTDEFIRYVQAVSSQEQNAVTETQPEGLQEQPLWIQDLWEKWMETLDYNGGDRQEGLRIETWFTNPTRWTRCTEPRLAVLSPEFRHWERELLAVWFDRAEMALPTHFAIVYPTPDDVDRTVQEQLVIEQQPEPFSKSVVVSIYDTAYDRGRPKSQALVMSDRLDVSSIVTLLGYADVCPPESRTNECLVWMGNVAIRPDQTLHVRTGNALRFLIRRGVRVGIPELLSMTDDRLRAELQAAITGDIYRRPNVPGFPADPHSNDNPEPYLEQDFSSQNDYPPDWINSLQEVFDRHAIIENADEGPVIYILAWLVHGVHKPVCPAPSVVRLDRDNSWWRSEIIFPWRDAIVRGQPLALHFVDPSPPTPPGHSHVAHIILSQAVRSDQVAVLLSGDAETVDAGRHNQVAIVVNQYAGIPDLTRLARSSSAGLPNVVVQRGRQIFPERFTVRVGNGDGIVVSASPSAHAAELPESHQVVNIPMQVDNDSIQAQAELPDAENEQVDKNRQADDVAFMQSFIHAIPAEYSTISEESFRQPECALEIQHGEMPEETAFQFNPNAVEFMPQEHQLPAWAQVIEDIYHDWDANAFAWQGESRATHFMTWYVAPGIGRVQCLYGRKITLFADFWNWREQFRQKWIDELDQRAEIQLVYVSPSPTHLEPGIVGHVILLQFNSPEWSSILLSVYDNAINNAHPFKMVHALPERLQMQQIVVRIGYAADCTHAARCGFRLRGHLLAVDEWIRAADGDALDFLVQRHVLPQNWNPPFIPHAPGAEGLALLQRGAQVTRIGSTHDANPHISPALEESTKIKIAPALSHDTCDIDQFPFTLASLFSQAHEHGTELVVCIWELNDRNCQFEFHRRNGFDAAQVCQQFRQAHGLVQPCSELHLVRFSRPHWGIGEGNWHIGSYVRPSDHKAVIACVAYSPDGATAKVITAPKCCTTSALRSLFSIRYGTLIRHNGVVLEDSVKLESGDTLEYHASPHDQGIEFDYHSQRVQICLDASIDSCQSTFDEDRDAVELLQFPNLQSMLADDDGWSFSMIPEGVCLHRETFEALRIQHEVSFSNSIAYELYIDGATHGDVSAWAIVAVGLSDHGRIFHGCIGGLTDIDHSSQSWIGADEHTNINAELSAMAVATAFAHFGAADRSFVIRPDLALSRKFLTLESTSRHGSILAQLVHVLGQSKPDNVTVREVRAHQGDPWNELADAVAKHIAKHRIAVGEVPWRSINTIVRSSSTLKWEWLRHTPPSFQKTMPVLHGDAVWQPDGSNRCIGARVRQIKDCPSSLTVSLNVITYNGLALNDDEQTISTAGSRSVRLDSQFHQVSAALVGIQEARTSEGCRCSDHYKIFSSGFEQCGKAKHFGCELWVHRFLPFCNRADGSAINLQDCKATVTCSEPRLLIVKFEGPIEFIVVVAHAPCVTAARPIDQVRIWWHKLTAEIRKYQASNTILLIDANAPLADQETQFFGTYQKETMNQQGFEFQDFIAINELYAPSTFPTHIGSAATWKHPRGDWLRRDYVLLSKSFFLICTKSQTISDFDGGFGHIDHCPAFCRIEGLAVVGNATKRLRWDFQKMQDPAAQQAFAAAIGSMPIPSWSTSIDDHSVVVETNILQIARQHFGASKREKLRPMLRESTLTGIQLKRQALDMARSQNFQDPLLLEELKLLEKQIRIMVVADQKTWYAEWLDNINVAGQNHDTAQVYKRLQRLGRRRKSLDKGPKPLPRLKINEADHAQSFQECQQVWKTQFAQVEAGIDVSMLQLAQLHASNPTSLAIDLEVCPDPAEILSIIRRFKNGKVPGPGHLPVDVIKCGGLAIAQVLTPLLVKASWHMREPLNWKGGLLVPLFKGKGSPNEPSAYRSIFLSDICAKIHHAKVRKTLASVWSEDASLIQLGGKKGCSTDIAHHLLHAHLSWARARTKSCAILFVDLQSAFYSILRASFFEGEFHDDAICFAMKQLGITPDEWHDIMQVVAQDHATRGLSGHQEGILRDMFSGTHFSMHGLDGKVATMRGTRPGDPVADILSNMAFRLVLLDARQRIQSVSEMSCFGSPLPAQDVTQVMPIPERGFAEITFVDDVAYTLHGNSATEVISSLQLVASCLHDVAAARGLAVNYQSGKTEAIVKLAGIGSRAVKHKVWHESAGKLPIVTEHGVQKLQVVHAYKHLGSYVQDHAVIQKDLRFRNAQARKAYGQLSKQFYSKKNVSDYTKCQVFAALVMSRHVYNVHTWAWITEADLQQWENGIRSQAAALARNTLRPISPFQFTTAELCALVGLHGPIDTLHANRLRYVKRAIQIAPSALWAFLHDNAMSQSWMPHFMCSYDWIAKHSRSGKIPAYTDPGDALSFIALDPNWNGTVRAALKACQSFRVAEARGKLWTLKIQRSISSLADAPDAIEMPTTGSWKCNLCDESFQSKKALAVHARHKHQYRTIMKYYVFGDECHACCKRYFNRPRLLAHVHASLYCKNTYLACFAPASEEDVDRVEAEEREAARTLRAAGWNPTKAFLPVIKVCGPPLPESGTEGAVAMKMRWQSRIQVMGRAYEGLDGFCEQTDLPAEETEVEILPFILQSNGGKVQGHAGVYQQFGLAAEAARLHIKCYLFIHFFSGHRREGDLQHLIESQEVVDGKHLFCISVGLCLARSHSDLTDETTKQFWISKMRGGQILGIGGGPSCETWSAARYAPHGPPPIRSYDTPWGCTGLTGKQWKQLDTGTKLIQFLIELLVIAAQLGLCGFFEHPQFPVWLMRQRPASVWTLNAMRALIRLECFQACSFDQCVYGLEATKPTTLILLRLSTFRDLTLTRGNRGRCSHFAKHQPLQGIRQDGSFATAKAKVYPKAMNRALATAVSRFLTERHMKEVSAPLPGDLQQLVSYDFIDESVIQPDYHR